VSIISCAAGAASVALAAVATLTLPTAAHASCAAPEIEASRTLVDPGQSVVVTGRYFAKTCNDTSVNGEPIPAAEPATVRIRFTQDGRAKRLATVTAGSDLTFSRTVTVPRWAEGGYAKLRAGQARPVEISIEDDGDPFVPLDAQVTPASTTSSNATAPADDDTGSDDTFTTGDGAGDGDSGAGEPSTNGGVEGEERLSQTGAGSTPSTAVLAVALLTLGGATVHGASLAGRPVSWYVTPSGTRRRRRVRR
jgi:hypothetical protein